MAEIPKRPETFFRLSPVENGKAQCFAVRRGELNAGVLGATHYAPELRIFLNRLQKHPSASGPLSKYAEFNPNISLNDLEPDSLVSFVPMELVEDSATGNFTHTTRKLSEVRKGYTPFADGDILWAKITPCMQNGKSCIVSGLKNGIGFGSTEFHVVRSKHPQLGTKFLWEFLNLTTLRKVAQYTFTGSAGHQRVPQIFLENLPFPFLSLKEQERLNDALEKARKEHSAKLAEADALLAGLDDFLLKTLGLTAPPKIERRAFAIKYRDLQSRFDPKTYLYRKHTSEKLFPMSSLGSLTITEPDYGSGARAIERTSDDQPKYIRITDFQDDGIPLGHKFVTAETIEQSCTLADGDLLFARSGATAGKTFIYSNDIGPAVFAGYCIRFRFDLKRVLPSFVYYFTKTSVYREWVATIQRPSGQPNINKEEFKSLEIPVPPPVVQQEIVEQLNAQRRKVFALRAEADAGWQAAKKWFEELLLGTAKP